MTALLERFGEDQELLGELSGNIASFGWMGSLVPYYERYLGPLRELEGHTHSAVRAWAAAERSGLERSIADEQRRESEREFGVY